MTITSQIDEDNIRTNAEKSPIFKQMKSKKKANTYSYKKITDLDDFDEAVDHESIRKSPIKRNPRDYNESTNKKVKTNNKAIDAANIWENNSNTSSRRSPNKRKPVDCNLSPNQQKSKYSKQKKLSTQDYTIEPPQTIETEPVSDFDEDNIRTNTEESQVFKQKNSNNRADIFSYKRTLNLDDFYKACNQESIRKSPIKRKPIKYTTSKNRKIKRLDMPIDDVNILGKKSNKSSRSSPIKRKPRNYNLSSNRQKNKVCKQKKQSTKDPPQTVEPEPLSEFDMLYLIRDQKHMSLKEGNFTFNEFDANPLIEAAKRMNKILMNIKMSATCIICNECWYDMEIGPRKINVQTMYK